MSYTRTTLQLLSSITNRWQLDNSPDLGLQTATGKATLLEMLNDAIVEYHDILIQKWQDYVTVGPTTFVTVVGTDSYALDTIASSSDFYKLRKIEIQDGTRYRRILPADLDSSHHFTTTGPVSRRYRYRLQGDNLVLMPAPSAVDTLRFWYVRQATQLVNDNDTISFRVPVAQKLLLAIVGRDVLDRQELETGHVERRIEKLTKQLMDAADGLDVSEPFYIDGDGPPPEFDEDWPY